MRSPAARVACGPVLAGSVFTTLLLLCGSARVDAQDGSPVYVHGGVLGDIKRFSGNPTENTLDGEAMGVAAGLGVPVGGRWEIELGIELPRTSEVAVERSMMLRTTRVSVQSVTKNRAVAVTTLARLRPGSPRLVQLGYAAGLSLVHLKARFETRAPSAVPPSFVPRAVDVVEYRAAPTLGVDARIRMSAHLHVVPAFSATALGGQETSGLLLRPRIGVHWTF